MFTTRSQKSRIAHQESIDNNVSEGLISPVLMESGVQADQDAMVVGPSDGKSPRIENNALEGLRASLKDEITSEIKILGIPKRTAKTVET